MVWSSAKSQLVTMAMDYQSLDILETLGCGGFGSVHLAELDGQRVAVKVSHQRPKADQKSIVNSFLAETQASKLHHENIVRILGVCLENGGPDCVGPAPILVMEYAGQRNLQRVIEDPSENIDCQRRLRFALDISNALMYAHSHNFLHLDVKPSNVIVSDRDTCKLGDFGCSQLAPNKADPLTPTSSSLTGTFAYRAPELLRGRLPTDRSDIYSLAVCLWQLLSRERPYGYEEHQIVVFAVVAYHLRPEFSSAMAVPATDEREEQVLSYRSLVEESWQADPVQRPSAQSVVSRLQAIRSSVEIEHSTHTPCAPSD